MKERKFCRQYCLSKNLQLGLIIIWVLVLPKIMKQANKKETMLLKICKKKKTQWKKYIHNSLNYLNELVPIYSANEFLQIQEELSQCFSSEKNKWRIVKMGTQFGQSWVRKSMTFVSVIYYI